MAGSASLRIRGSDLLEVGIGQKRAVLQQKPHKATFAMV